MRRSPALVSDILMSARPKQWIKNAFVFAALIFGAKLGHPTLVAKTVLAFLLFCLLSSALYLLNDAADVEADRRHPYKAGRPIAAGRLPISVAVALAIVGVVVGSVLALLLDVHFGLIAIGYVALTSAYTFYLKHLVLIDVFSIAGGFVLRAAAGAAVINVIISPWLYLCTILLSLFLGFGKRRHELLLLETEAGVHRRNLEEYTGPLLDDLINITAGATLIAYSLYTFFATTSTPNHTNAMMITIPFVLYGIFRYLLLIHRADFAGSPEEAVWKDPALLADLVAWAVTAEIVLRYFR